MTSVVLYPKDTEKWKQFTTMMLIKNIKSLLFCIPKILKNESNSQLFNLPLTNVLSCFVSQRYWKMKAIHNAVFILLNFYDVVLYPKDTEKWKQFTTYLNVSLSFLQLFCIPKILKNESNSQLNSQILHRFGGCFVSQRYRKMKSSKGKARRFGVAKAIQNLRAVGKEITKAFEEAMFKRWFSKIF